MSGANDSSKNTSTPRVLLIAGSGHSGSTLLGMLLGSIDGFLNVGELRWFWSNVAADRGRCGCGSPMAQCDFWSTISADLTENGVPIDRIAAYTTKWGHTASLPRWAVLGRTRASRSELGEYASATRSLYQAIAARAPGRRIVDGSKLPAYLLLVRRLADVDLRILHLLRDGRAVAYAWHKRYVERPPRQEADPRAAYRAATTAMLVWVLQNFLLERMAKQQRLSTLMRYEDFCRAPADELRAALTALELDGGTFPGADSHVILARSHSIGGSDRVRFEPSDRSVVLDAEWRNRLKRPTQMWLTLLGGAGLRRFGYLGRDSAAGGDRTY